MSLLNTITYYLIHHPKITNFDWSEPTTQFTTLRFLILTILTYLTLVLTLTTFPLPTLPPPLPTLLRRISSLYNLLILLLSLTMSVSTALAFSHQFPATLPHLFCLPVPTPPRGPTFFWGYTFYLSKILEFTDTFLIILSDSTTRRLTFLHVYHHGTVLVMCYIWLETSQSLFPVALVTNTSVHTVMYMYYLLCSVGVRPSWKRLVTDCQIVQFVFGFVVSFVMLYYHVFTESRCSGFGGWCFNAVFNASLLYLFLDFHSKNYKNKNKKKKDRVVKGEDKVGDEDKVL